MRVRGKVIWKNYDGVPILEQLVDVKLGESIHIEIPPVLEVPGGWMTSVGIEVIMREVCAIEIYLSGATPKIDLKEVGN